MESAENSRTLKKAALIAAIMGLSAWAMDMAATQVALPTIQTTLNMSVTQSQWVLNIAIMALAGLVTLGGWLGDHHGRVRVFRWGFILLLAGSLGTLLCGLTSQVTLLFVARAVEGVSAALLIPASTALLIDVFSIEERGKAMGTVFGTSMVVVAFGPIIAGALIQTAGWAWVYVLPLTFAGIGIISLTKVSYNQQSLPKTKMDLIGAVLLFATVVFIIYGFLEAGALGWTNPIIIMSIAGGMVLGAIFLYIELHKPDPLIHLKVLEIRNVSIALLVTLMRFLPNAILSLFLIIYVQEVLHFTPFMAGFVSLPFIFASMFTAGWAGKLFDQKGPRVPVPISAALFAVSMVIAAIGFNIGNFVVLAVALVVGGAGISFSNTVQTAAMNATHIEQRGMVAGLMPLSGQFGTAIWIALVTSLQVTIVSSLTTGQKELSSGAAMSQALMIISLVVAVIMVLVFFVTLKLEGGAPGSHVQGPGAKQTGENT
jgi:MFS family permease